jgi:hypothetical protein
MNANCLPGAVARHVPRHAGIFGLLLGVALLGACQTQQQQITSREDKLSAAGFIIKPANTPDRQAMLTRLPASQFVQRQNGDTIHYVYSDPIVCGCLYVGTQQAYNQYRANQLAQHLADEQQLNAQMYNDAAWNWDAWGPWGGPMYPGFGFAYGPVGW